MATPEGEDEAVLIGDAVETNRAHPRCVDACANVGHCAAPPSADALPPVPRNRPVPEWSDAQLDEFLEVAGRSQSEEAAAYTMVCIGVCTSVLFSEKFGKFGTIGTIGTD